MASMTYYELESYLKKNNVFRKSIEYNGYKAHKLYAKMRIKRGS